MANTYDAKKMIKTISTVLKKKSYLVIFVLLTIAFFALFIAIPVYTIIGNDLAFQLSTYNIYDYLLLTVLSVLSGLMFTLQLYKWKYGRKVCDTTVLFAGSVGAGVSGIIASIVGTSVCVGCIAPFLAIFGFGFGAVSFVLSYQLYFSLFAILIMLISLYFISKSLN